MPLLRPWVYFALFSLYLASAWALVIFSVQMSKRDRYMISDTISSALGETPLTQTAKAASYTVLFIIMSLSVSIIIDLKKTWLFYPVFFSGAFFIACLSCDANAGRAEPVCHNISCTLSGILYFLVCSFIWQYITDALATKKVKEPNEWVYKAVFFALTLSLSALAISVLFSLALIGDTAAYVAVGVSEMVLFFFSVCFVSLSVPLAKKAAQCNNCDQGTTVKEPTRGNIINVKDIVSPRNTRSNEMGL